VVNGDLDPSRPTTIAPFELSERLKQEHRCHDLRLIFRGMVSQVGGGDRKKPAR